MWTYEVMGTGMDILHLTQMFITYSMLGWLVESIYMSFCNRKLTNRGFAKGPFCPIYGFGGLAGYLILRPLSDHKFLLYFAGALLATAFEYMVAKLMERTLGDVWWDYSEKPLNYQGVICAESTVAWGAYAVIIVCYLHNFIMQTVDRIPTQIGIMACRVILLLYAIDFGYHLVLALDINVRAYLGRMRDSYHTFRTKWW